MAETLQFVKGDELIETFLVEHSDGEILDLTGLSVRGVIRWKRHGRILLTVGAEIEVETMAPVRAADPVNQQPHGFFRLTEDQTAIIPYGAVAFLRMTVIETGVTLSTFEYPLEILV